MSDIAHVAVPSRRPSTTHGKPVRWLQTLLCSCAVPAVSTTTAGGFRGRTGAGACCSARLRTAGLPGGRRAKRSDASGRRVNVAAGPDTGPCVDMMRRNGFGCPSPAGMPRNSLIGATITVPGPTCMPDIHVGGPLPIFSMRNPGFLTPAPVSRAGRRRRAGTEIRQGALESPAGIAVVLTCFAAKGARSSAG